MVYTPWTSERKSGASTFDRSNYLGTFSRQTNASQSTTATRVYCAFGNLESTTCGQQSPFGFVRAHGYQEDGDSGLKLLGHRYYDSSPGRFLTRDRARDGRNWDVYGRSRSNYLIDNNGLNIIGEFFEADFEACDDWSGTDGYDHDGHPIKVGGWRSKFIPDGTAETYGGTIHLPDVPTAGQFNRPRSFHWRDHEEGHIVQQGNMPSPIYVGVYGLLAVICGVDELTNPGIPPSHWGPPGHDHNPMETLAEDYAWDKEGNSGNEGTWGR